MKKLSLIIVSALLLASCDGPYKDCPEHRYSANFKSNAIFNPGSYWVFEDTALNITDSVFLKSQEFFFDDICDYHGQPTDILNQTFSFSRNGSSSDFSVYATAEENVYGSWGGQGYYSEDCAADPSVSCSTSDSMQVNGAWFFDISTFSQGDNATYWSKNIGVIKKQYPKYGTDTVYHLDLIRYHIN